MNRFNSFNGIYHIALLYLKFILLVQKLANRDRWNQTVHVEVDVFENGLIIHQQSLPGRNTQLMIMLHYTRLCAPNVASRTSLLAATGPLKYDSNRAGRRLEGAARA